MSQGIEHVPTEKTRATVETMSMAGVTQDDIALVLEICKDTLAKHYSRELETATSRAVGKVAASLYRKAISDDHPQAVTGAIFFLKTRGKWREASSDLTLSTPDGKSPFVMNIIVPDKPTDEE